MLYGDCLYGSLGGTYGNLCPPPSPPGRSDLRGRRLRDDDLIAISLSLLIGSGVPSE